MAFKPANQLRLIFDPDTFKIYINHKKTDCIIFGHYSFKQWIFLLEMKRNKIDPKEVSEQFKVSVRIASDFIDNS